MEQKKSISIFSAVALFLYISAIIFFCISLLSEYKTAEQLVENRFKKLAKSTQETYKTETKNTATFTNAMLQIINSTSDIASVFVMEGSDTLFEWPQGSTGENTSPLIKSYSTEIAQDINGSVIIMASLYVLKPESIYKTAKISFIVVLAATLCTVVFFVYINITGSMPSEKPFIDLPKLHIAKKGKKHFTDEKKDISDEVKDEKEKLEEFNENSVTFSRITLSHEQQQSASQSQKIDTPTSQPISPQPQNTSQPSIAQQEEYRADKTTYSTITTAFDSQEIEEPYTLTSETYSGLTTQDEPFTLTQETMSQPMQATYGSQPSTSTEEPDSLHTLSMIQESMNSAPETHTTQFQSSRYSPFTGFCWESFIDDATNAELEHAMAENKDVSLLFMQVIGLDRMDYTSEDVRSILYNAIGNRDLLFEYKSDGYAILLPQTDINGAIKIAELIEPKITELLKAQGKNAQLMIGISARTQRNVNAEVLHEEAEKALEHAEPSLPIIAFRVDPEKYKEFLEQTQV